MGAEAIASVSIAVTMLTQLVKWWGLPDQRGPVAVLLFSLAGVLLWGFTYEPTLQRVLIWPYFVAWLTVATSSAGIFGFTRAFPSAVTAGSKPPEGAGQNPVVKPGL